MTSKNGFISLKIIKNFLHYVVFRTCDGNASILIFFFWNHCVTKSMIIQVKAYLQTEKFRFEIPKKRHITCVLGVLLFQAEVRMETLAPNVIC